MDFYGVVLDKGDPYLSHNFDRLEKRFRKRYQASLNKKLKREQGGKSPHKTILKSIEDNEKRLLMVKVLREIMI